jgi:hypothetical protein
MAGAWTPNYFTQFSSEETALRRMQRRCMSEITTIFWDVGGMILTDGWDWDSRRQTAEHFNLYGKKMNERPGFELIDRRRITKAGGI